MRAIRFAMVVAVCVTLPLFGRDVPTISTLSPNTLRAQSGEWFVTLEGTHYLPSAGVVVFFSGPAGTIGLVPNASTDTNMAVWVPQEVLVYPGDYSVIVRVPNGAGTLDSNSVTLRISGKSIVVRVPKLVLAEAIDLTGGPAIFEATATSFFSDQVSVECSHKSGDLFPFDSTIVDCIATDDLGGSDKESFTVRVADTQPPAFDTPRDLLAFGKSEGAVVEYAVKASDLVDPEVKLICAPESGSFFRLGTSTVDCSSSDRFGNQGSTKFRVHVGTDTIPALVMPVAVAAEAESLEGAFVKYEATATTAAGQPADVRCEPSSGSLFPMKTTSVKCIAWGPGGESTTDFFDVTVADTKPPSLTLPSAITEQAPTAEGANVKYDATAKDAVDGATAVVCFPESGSLFAPGQTVVNCSAADRLGNAANGPFLVTVMPWVDETVYSAGPKSSQ